MNTIDIPVKSYEAVGSKASVIQHQTLVQALVDLIYFKSIGKPLGVLIRENDTARFVSIRDLARHPEAPYHD